MTTATRRRIFASLVVGTMALLALLMAYTLSFRGYTFADLVLGACFMITLPWTVIGFWNAVIGLILLRTKENPAIHVFPTLGTLDGNEAITASTAIAMCIRNEEPKQVVRNLDSIIARLVSSGASDKFTLYILSDSSEDDVISSEELAIAQLRRDWQEKFEIVYRRRDDNPGFKAGNIRDFCERWGHKHDFMLTLDADSVMSASAVLRMVRVMQKDAKLGILQSLVVGLPSDSGFTRVFQFGMRQGMKSYTIGGAWWQADCGPYWGHNALIRLEPFIEHCHLPKLPGSGPLSGWILSHDQVEAVYMRKAGFECRVLADESGSYEENPPHILEFIRRDLRWCHGNMQYFKLLLEPGLLPTSRVQLVLAILMFVSAPAWMLFVCVATLTIVLGQFAPKLPPQAFADLSTSNSGYILFAIVMTMIFAPKIASFVDVLLTPSLRKQYGGLGPVVFSTATETVFSMMLAPIMAIANTIFLFRLFVLRQGKGWTAQSRSVQSLPTATVLKHLWPQMLFGSVGFCLIFAGGFHTAFGLLICLPVFVGPLLAIPLGVSSSLPIFGQLSARWQVWQIPEEETPPVIIRALNLPVLDFRGKVAKSGEKYLPLSREDLLSIDVELENQSGALPHPVRIAA